MSVRIIWIVFIMFLPVFLCAEEAQNAELAAIFRTMSGVRTVSAKFTQEKTIRHLKRPIRISGQFHIDGSGFFAWIVETPIQYECVISDGRLTQWDAASGKIVKLELAKHPALSAMYESMRRFFSGEAFRSDADFNIRLLPELVVEFIPKQNAPAAKHLARMAMTVSQDSRYVTKIEIEETNGDRTVMSFNGVVTGKPLPDAVLRKADR